MDYTKIGVLEISRATIGDWRDLLGDNVNTKYIAEFLKFSETLNYTSTAKKLYLSATTLASHISELEAEIGVALVRKGRGGMLLTPAGQEFVSRGRRLLEAVDSDVEELRALAKRASLLSVAVTQRTDFEMFVQETAECFPMTHRGEMISLASLPAQEDGVDALKETNADIAELLRIRRVNDPIVDPEIDDAYESAYLFSETVSFRIDSGCSLFGKQSICSSDVNGMNILFSTQATFGPLYESFLSIMEEEGVYLVPKYICIQSNFDYANYHFPDTLVFLGNTLPRLYPLRNCQIFEIEDLPLCWDVYVVYRKDAEESVLSFIEALRANASDATQ